jgi:hypothetical protein
METYDFQSLDQESYLDALEVVSVRRSPAELQRMLGGNGVISALDAVRSDRLQQAGPVAGMIALDQLQHGVSTVGDGFGGSVQEVLGGRPSPQSYALAA